MNFFIIFVILVSIVFAAANNASTFAIIILSMSWFAFISAITLISTYKSHKLRNFKIHLYPSYKDTLESCAWIKDFALYYINRISTQITPLLEETDSVKLHLENCDSVLKLDSIMTSKRALINERDNAYKIYNRMDIIFQKAQYEITLYNNKYRKKLNHRKNFLIGSFIDTPEDLKFLPTEIVKNPFSDISFTLPVEKKEENKNDE